MTDIADIGAARHAKSDEAKKSLPRDALSAALAAIDSGEINPIHVIVCHYDEKSTGFYQAGSATNVTVTGMLQRCINLIWRHVA